MNIDDKIRMLEARLAELKAEKAEKDTVNQLAKTDDKIEAEELHREFCTKPHNAVGPDACYWQVLEDGTPDWAHPANVAWLKKAIQRREKREGKDKANKDKDKAK